MQNFAKFELQSFFNCFDNLACQSSCLAFQKYSLILQGE